MTSTWANQWEGQWTNVSSDAKIRPSDCERGGKIDKLGVPTPIQYLQKVVTSDDGDVVPTILVKFSKTEKATIQQYIKHESLEACVNHIRTFESLDEKLELSANWESWAELWLERKTHLHAIGEEPPEEGEDREDPGGEPEPRDDDGVEVIKTVREWIKEEIQEAKDEMKRLTNE